jgi:RHS repeat-associated protein
VRLRTGENVHQGNFAGVRTRIMAVAQLSPCRIKRNHRRRRPIASGRREYNYFRDYDSSTGRYAESDPIGLEGGASTYSFVAGTPLSYIDPLALDRIVTYQNIGWTVYYDDQGSYVNSWPSRSDVAKRSLPGAAGPYHSDHVYPANGPNSGNPIGYGPNDLLKTDDRRLRWLHGGGTGLPDPLAPRQGWKPTLGCTRMQNEDIQNLVDYVRQVQKADPNRAITYDRFNYIVPKIISFW